MKEAIINDQAITISEIADLLSQLRALTYPAPADPIARAQVLARKADLLARIADQHADQWTCEHANQARQVAHDALLIAAQARAVAEREAPLNTHRVGPNQRRTAHPPSPRGGAKSEKNSGASSG